MKMCESPKWPILEMHINENTTHRIVLTSKMDPENCRAWCAMYSVKESYGIQCERKLVNNSTTVQNIRMMTPQIYLGN